VPDEVRRVVLVGFMASGKTTVAGIVAAALGWEHLDLDREIERAAGRSVAEIFRERGEPAFRRLEDEITTALLGRVPSVWSPGGGWIASPGRLPSLGPGTLSIWLRVSPEAALERAVSSGAARPLLRALDPLGRVRSLLAEREPLYAAADRSVETTGRPPEAVAGDVLEAVGLVDPVLSKLLRTRNG
jgi:shikimate kinase